MNFVLFVTFYCLALAILSLALFPIEQKSHTHNYRKNDKVEEDGECELALRRGLSVGTDSVGVDGYEYHKECGDRSEDGHYYILELTAILAFLYDI